MKNLISSYSRIFLLIAIFFSPSLTDGGELAYNTSLYPLLNREVSPLIFSLGGCSVMQNGQEDMVFFNPAGLIGDMLNSSWYGGFNVKYEPNSNNVFDQDYNLVTFAGRVGFGEKFPVALGFGFRSQQINAPHWDIDHHSHSPIPEGDVISYEDRVLSFGGAVSIMPNLRAGFAYHSSSTKFDQETGKGGELDIGAQWILLEPNNYSIQLGAGIEYQGCLDKDWGDYKEESDLDVVSFGYYVGANKGVSPIMWRWYNDFEFDLNSANLTMLYREMKVGFEITPLASNFIDVDFRMGLQSRNYNIPSVNGSESGINWSFRLGGGLTLNRGGSKMVIDLGMIILKDKHGTAWELEGSNRWMLSVSFFGVLNR
ncbi:MAG: hypothetical protein P9M15_02550 [Candidatus Electryoneaceae bacterium]|nr:hypothetical protein [Candidatus Electryoneaceae bacterium]